MTPFAQALYDIILEEDSTATVEVLRNLAFEKIQKGEVKSLISSSINGKSFSYNISKAADVLFQEASWAIRQFNRGSIKAVQFDFSSI